jgi:hypothetical protein
MSATRDSISPRTQQAVRIVATQLECSDEEALRRLRERANVGQYRLHDYAGLVVDGIIRFDL